MPGPKVRIAELNCAYADAGRDKELAMDSWDGQRWYGHSGAGVGIRVADSPALIAYGGRLLCYFQDANNQGQLTGMFYDDGKWSVGGPIPGARLALSPSAVEFRGRLYLFYQDEHYKGELLCASWEDGQPWRIDGRVPGVTMSCSPGAVVYHDVLYVFYQDERNNG